MRLTLATAMVVALLGASGCAGSRVAARLNNKPAPSFALQSLDGTTVRLSDYRGKPVVLALWALG